jgi:hypothetical protein
VGRRVAHNHYCQQCGGGQGGARALHGCTFCFNAYHTACTPPGRAEMVLPGVVFACPVCVGILQDALEAGGHGSAVDDAVEEAAGGKPLPRPDLDAKAVYHLLTRWTHWGEERIAARWAVIHERFEAALATWPDEAARKVAAALDGSASGHPMIALEPSGYRVVRPAAAAAADDDGGA